MKLYNITCQISVLQRTPSFFASFDVFYLGNPNDGLAYKQEQNQYKGTRDARVIYNINAYTQKVCTKFFHNFMHTFFACINEWIVCAKQGFNNV